MIVKCPKCGTRYKLDETKFAGPQKRLKCTKCTTVFTVNKPASTEPPAAEATATQQAAPQPAAQKPPAQQAPAPKPPAAEAKPKKQPPPLGEAPAPKIYGPEGAPLVLVAAENADECKKLATKVMQSGFRVMLSVDGVDAYRKIMHLRPDISVVDVSMPRVMGYDITEFVKGDDSTKQLKILLLTSSYNDQAYTRSPNNLYGADDFIARHDLDEKLIPKIKALASGESPAPAAPQAAAPPPAAGAPPTSGAKPPAAAEATATAAAPPTSGAAPPAAHPEADSPEHQNARRLARIIASDIALYNQDAIETGLREGNLFELLKKDIEEGKELYNGRVPEEVRSSTNYLKDAFQDMIERKRKELGL